MPNSIEPGPSSSTAPLDLTAIPIWRVGWTDGVAEPEDALRVGLADGTISARIKTGNMWWNLTDRVVRGPVSGEVLYGRTVANGIELHLVGAATGVDRVVGRIPPAAQDAEIGLGGGAIYWIDASRETGGAWRLDIATGERSLVLPRVEVAVNPSGMVVAASPVPRTQLALSADGTRLAALWCGIEGCVLQLVHFGDHAIEAMQLAEWWHELFGFVDDHVVSLRGACADVAAQRVLDQDCAAGDAYTFATIWAVQLQLGAELPEGWRLGAMPVPNTDPMSFTVQPVALPDAGGGPVPLEALGIGSGQG